MGVLLFALLEWVSVLYNLPVNIVILLASANVIYGIYALTLAFLVTKPVYTITVLAIANAVWVLICIFYCFILCTNSKFNWRCVYYIRSCVCVYFGILRIQI
ncbi:hypothetical protein ATW7_13023 [Alteromonadales bacterium TW-7]|nr:hypothetical protein ATW7_13023 [Alteromonadales bacterium TW-7]